MQIIDKAVWPRRERFDFFAPMSNPFYALTFPVDVTPLRRRTKAEGLSFYYAMVFAVTKAMEEVEAFRYRIREEQIVLHDRLIPSFTDLKPGGDLFYIVTLEAGDDLADFCRRARAASQAQTEFFPKTAWAEDEQIYFSCLPWFPITGLINERDTNPADSVPRVTWGKYEEEAGKTMLSLSLEVNHSLIDGVHVGQLYQALNRLMAVWGNGNGVR